MKELSLPFFLHGLDNLKRWEDFFQPGKSRGILNRLEKFGNFTQNTGKIRKFPLKCWKYEEILANFYLNFFSDFLIEVYLLNRFLYLLSSLNKTEKILENGKKILEKSGTLLVRKCGNHDYAKRTWNKWPWRCKWTSDKTVNVTLHVAHGKPNAHCLMI